MKMLLKKIIYWIDDTLRLYCGKLSPDTRVVSIVLLSIIFAISFLYIFISSVYNIGKNHGQAINIEHIYGLDTNHNTTVRESIYKIMYNEYENDNE